MSAFKRIYVQNDGTPFEEDSNSDWTTIPDQTVQLVNAGENTPTNGAAPGETIDTSSDVGNSLDITDYNEVQLIFRDGDYVDVSPVIDVTDLEVSDFDFLRPSQQVTTVDFPSAPSSDQFWTVKVSDLESGNQPYPRRSFEVEVLSSWSNQQIVENFIDNINNSEDQINDFQGTSVYGGIEYGTNASVALGTPSAGDDFNLTIESTTYTEAVVGGDERQTFENFISSHGDDIFNNHGVTFRIDSNDDLVIFQAEGYDLTLTDAGDLDATISGANGTTVTLTDASMANRVLRLTAKDVGDIFDVATRNFNADSITQQHDPTDGVGTPAQVEKYEHRDDGTVGRYVESTNLLGSLPGPPEYAQSNGEYDLLTFSFEGDSEKAVNKSIARQTYVVALEATAVGNATDTNTNGEPDYSDFLSPVVVATT